MIHTSAQTQDEVQRALPLDVVVEQCAVVLELLAGKDEPHLIERDAHFLLDHTLQLLDQVEVVHVKRN